jgi:ribosomal protein L37AE/L43A
MGAGGIKMSDNPNIKCPKCGEVDWNTKDAYGNYNCGYCGHAFKKGAPLKNNEGWY